MNKTEEPLQGRAHSRYPEKHIKGRYITLLADVTSLQELSPPSDLSMHPLPRAQPCDRAPVSLQLMVVTPASVLRAVAAGGNISTSELRSFLGSFEF